MRILLAEGDISVATFLQLEFEVEHYVVDLARDGGAASSMAGGLNYDAVILGLNLPRGDGIEILQQIRAKREQLPILILADRTTLEERVQVLDLGADDLLIKPFEFSELAARVRALLRRSGRSPDTVFRVDDLELGRVDHIVHRAGRNIELTPKEFSLLEYLMRSAGECVTRAQIIENVWNLPSDTMTNIVDVYINYLRKKVDGGSDRKLIHTIRGVGYQLLADRPASDGEAPDYASTPPRARVSTVGRE